MSEQRQFPLWRSLLFVPVNVERFVEKAHTRGADALILDLEDSIAPADKESARLLLPGAAARVARGGADVLVRINRPLRLAIRDLEAAIGHGVSAVMLPKVESASHVRLLSETVAELESERGTAVGSTRFIALIESAEAFLRAQEIAASDRRVVALSLGSEDFSLSVGMAPEPEGLFYPKMHTVIAAAAAGILPLGFVGSIADYRDQEAFRAIVRHSRRLGFRGATAIHPDQVRILNEEFRPTEEEAAQAERVIKAYDEALAAGRGSVVVDGKMVDAPIVERARRTLEQLATIAEHQRRVSG